MHIGHTNTDSRPIGVFDSGVGGISVLKALVQRLPNERFIYYGDSANAPYGVKSREEILSLSRSALNKLLSFDVKAVVIACNTATAAAAEVLRAEHEDLPILGVEPAIRPAAFCGKHPTVLIMATPMTLKMDKFKTLEKELSDLAQFLTLPCPGLVELIEQGLDDQETLCAFLQELLAPHLKNPPKAVVLGCTHYPFIKPLLKRFFPEDTAFFDGAEGTARQLEKRLCEEGLCAPKENAGGVRFLSSKQDGQALFTMERFFKSI